MRLFIPNILTEQEASYLRMNIPHTALIRGRWDYPGVDKIVNIIKEHAPISTDGGYFIIENTKEGHDKHYDGCELDLQPNHMDWCAYSASILLTDASTFEGGTFHFYEPEESHREDHYRSLVLYSSAAHNDPQMHSVTPHKNGNRTVLLMFFPEDKDLAGQSD